MISNDNSGLDKLKLIIQTHMDEGEQLKKVCFKNNLQIPHGTYEGYKQALTFVLKTIQIIESDNTSE